MAPTTTEFDTTTSFPSLAQQSKEGANLVTKLIYSYIPLSFKKLFYFMETFVADVVIDVRTHIPENRAKEVKRCLLPGTEPGRKANSLKLQWFPLVMCYYGTRVEAVDAAAALPPPSLGREGGKLQARWRPLHLSLPLLR